MNEAARLIIGRRDFTSFSKLHTDVKTNICDLREARWHRDGDEGVWYFEITADRFLRNMVRAVIGTLVDVGRHKMRPPISLISSTVATAVLQAHQCRRRPLPVGRRISRQYLYPRLRNTGVTDPVPKQQFATDVLYNTSKCLHATKITHIFAPTPHSSDMQTSVNFNDAGLLLGESGRDFNSATYSLNSRDSVLERMTAPTPLP